MRTRRIIAVALAVLALPLLVLGLVDPLEGGIVLLAAIAIGVVVWAVSRVRVPALLWISLLATVAVGALTLGLAAIMSGPGGSSGGTAANAILPLIGLLWLWRVGVLVVAAGAILYIARLFRSSRSPASAER